MSDCITISGYKKASWIFSNTKGGISRKNRMVLEILYSSSLITGNEKQGAEYSLKFIVIDISVKAYYNSSYLFNKFTTFVNTIEVQKIRLRGKPL